MALWQTSINVMRMWLCTSPIKMNNYFWSLCSHERWKHFNMLPPSGQILQVRCLPHHPVKYINLYGIKFSSFIEQPRPHILLLSLTLTSTTHTSHFSIFRFQVFKWHEIKSLKECFQFSLQHLLVSILCEKGEFHEAQRTTSTAEPGGIKTYSTQ